MYLRLVIVRQSTSPSKVLMRPDTFALLQTSNTFRDPQTYISLSAPYLYFQKCEEICSHLAKFRTPFPRPSKSQNIIISPFRAPSEKTATEKNRIIDEKVEMSAVGRQTTPPAEELRAYNKRNAANPYLIYKRERCPDAKFCRSSHVIWNRGKDDDVDDKLDAIVIAGPDLVPHDGREQKTTTKRRPGKYTWHTYFVRYQEYGKNKTEIHELHVAEVDLIARKHRNRRLD
ncbi:predicted protein [Sclerotinia sclerotiorum 1980 UF-70]|uniref:Uncharacterized protein n=2 Tax=Sclerotinia sclerotiorum (strain ATCC 18683 / 1980 / Ss-1) TaxID=665079 RepID=A7F7M3_SCLS1|nr:predicted protein [Sclerotinia sclerotiorum 1980 UF-70]APA15044.1 hypothetical protein sscle_14g098140 [Sclerotinia sclerotiorum 1980 UF-70]EDN98744.1 predicted protein [Sclerotinia sclerotiorum 1980 UF-70]